MKCRKLHKKRFLTAATFFYSHRLLDEEVKGVQCLILVPSRELGLQIEQVWKKMGTSLKVNTCYGGHSIETEIKNLSNPPAVLIGTPGRIADHIDRGTFETDSIKTLILDEFDKSLQLGFHEQMSFIIGKLTSDTAALLLGKYASENIESIIDNTFSWQSIAGLALSVGLLFGLFFIDWRTLIQKKKLVFNFKIWK